MATARWVFGATLRLLGFRPDDVARTAEEP
jgi:hypothetical protein